DGGGDQRTRKPGRSVGSQACARRRRLRRRRGVMGFWGGGAGAGGWSQGLGGQAMGPRAHRGTDGWDEEYLGKVYDGRVVQRIAPYLMQYKPQAALAFTCMIVNAVGSFSQPLLIGLTVKA